MPRAMSSDGRLSGENLRSVGWSRAGGAAAKRPL